MQERTAACGALTAVLDRIATPGDGASRFAVRSRGADLPGDVRRDVRRPSGGSLPVRRSLGEDRRVAALVREAVERARDSELRATAQRLPVMASRSGAARGAPAGGACARRGPGAAPTGSGARRSQPCESASGRIRPAMRSATPHACSPTPGPRCWPSCASVVRQVALIDGFGIDGFTDVATHGAIYVNSARLGADDGGLPGPVRLAEALVHEGAHNRCNAAALTDPVPRRFERRLRACGHDAAARGSSPAHRPAPAARRARPQRPVVRPARLAGARAKQAAAVRARGDKLRDQADEALRAIAAHTGKLTDHGRAVVTESGELLARSGRADEPAFT